MFKKPYLILLVTGILLVVVVIIYNLNGSSTAKPFTDHEIQIEVEIDQMQTIYENKDMVISLAEKIDPGEKAAIVNGVPIPLRSVVVEAALQELISSEISREDVLDARVKSVLFYLEAQRRGLEASEEEARNFVEKTRATYQEIEDKYSKSLFEITLVSKGLSEEEYWELSVEDYRRSLSVGRLRQLMSDEEFEKLGEELKEKADIQYLVDLDSIQIR